MNEVRFHTKDHEARRRTQNSGLVVEGEHKKEKMDFFGFLSSVVELVYLGGRKVVIFRCEWFDTGKRTGNRKTIQDDNHFISIDIRSRWYKQDPFVLPVHVQQVFYVNDTKLGNNWNVVQRVQHRHLWDLPSNTEKDKEDDVGTSSAQTPMQQYESAGVIEVIDDDLVGGLVRDDIEPDEIDMEEFLKLRKEKPTQVDDDEDCDELDELENLEHFFDGENIGDDDELGSSEDDTMEPSDSEEDNYGNSKRKIRCMEPKHKRRCKCHL